MKGLHNFFRHRDRIFGLLLLAARAAGQEEHVRIIEGDLEKQQGKRHHE